MVHHCARLLSVISLMFLNESPQRRGEQPLSGASQTAEETLTIHMNKAEHDNPVKKFMSASLSLIVLKLNCFISNVSFSVDFDLESFEMFLYVRDQLRVRPR